MFGRAKAQQLDQEAGETPPSDSLSRPVPDPTAASQARRPPTGKGRPTPRRSEAQQRNRRPLVAPPPKPGVKLTKAERKAQRAERKAAIREARIRQHQGLLSGEERYLPARDRGPARRFARDYVDSRWNMGEVFIPLALIVVLLGLTSPVAAVYSTFALYGLMLLVAIDVLLLRRRLSRLAAARFGAEASRGVGGYGMMRSLQLRRMRMPKPQGKRGEIQP